MPAHTIPISSIPPGFYYPLAHPYFSAQQYPVAQPTPYPAVGPAQQATSNPAGPIQPTTQSGSTSISGQATSLPHAFTDGTLHDPTTGAWNMDTVKDFMTRQVLLRYDSMGDLYPVMTPSPIPHAFLVSQHTWHQSLGHPGSGVLRRLVSNNVISCNKEKPLVLCHACQLGKHVRLQFFSSTTVVTSCFNIIHSDVWTSPILSLSGFKYYWPLIYLNAQLSSYTSCHLEVSELAACLEKLHFATLLVMSKFSRICFSFDFKSALHHESSL
ncbi:ribonuclease H-like domain-containing protein [Tanacetum coccineum]